MKLNILNVGYPFAPVRPDSVGGAEQVLSALDRGLVGMGCRSLVIAPVGSSVKGILHPVPAHEGPIDNEAREGAWERQHEAIDRLVRTGIVDVVHMHGVDFAAYMPSDPIPTLVTLHLPLSFYGAEALAELRRPNVTTNLVSASQRRSGGETWQRARVIENGVFQELITPEVKGDYVLCLGRVCPEKGFHDAIAAAKEAGVPLVLAGRVYPYPEHQAYFQDVLMPLFDGQRRFVGPVAGARKRKLIARARCVLIPSTVAETSSLVAMEALALGTPVVARPVGALPDIIDEGRTGFLADGVHEMAEAIRASRFIDPQQCLWTAHVRWNGYRMLGEYVSLYGEMLRGSPVLAQVASSRPPHDRAACH